MRRCSAPRTLCAALLFLVLTPTGAPEALGAPRAGRGGRDLRIVAAGDTAHPKGWSDAVVERAGVRLFESVRDEIARADIAFVNLEAAVSEGAATERKTYVAVTPPARVNWLTEAGFNLFSLANNHAADAGAAGVRDTVRTFRESQKRLGIHWAGLGDDDETRTRTAFFTPRGKRLKVAFLAFGNGSSRFVHNVNDHAALDRIRAARAKAELVIVSAHSGKEYQHVAEASKVRRYRAFVAAGADLVIGHHPHVLQGIERYKNGIIFYSLGNFSFASRTVRHRETGALMYGMLPIVTVRKGRLAGVEIVPLWVNNLEKWTLGSETMGPATFRPVRARGAFAVEIVKAIAGWSAAIPGNDTRITTERDRGVVAL